MEALTCLKCGAPLQVGLTACPYCRVGLAGMPSAGPQPVSTEQPRPPQSPAEIPSGWVAFEDRWNGFTLAHPPGWEVLTFQGQTMVRADPAGLTAASIAPFHWPAPVTARQLAQQYINQASRAIGQSFQAWLQGNTAPDSNRVTLRIRAVRFGQPVEGIYNILVEGTSCIASGYQAPPQQLAQMGPLMAQILAAFRTAAPMPRQTVREPGEGAFTIQIPEGWGWRAGVDRNNIGGSGKLQFSAASDAQGSVMASMPNYTWMFTDMGISFFTFPTGVPSLRFAPASQFIPQVILPQLRRTRPDVQVVKVVERPDWAEYNQFDLLQNGYLPGMFDVSTALMEVVYTENGQRLREKSRVNTLRQKGQPMWNAVMDLTYRAWDEEYASLEPVLEGSLFSLQVNPQWKAGERGLAQNFINNAQADIHRRQMEISRTLSETSDIITNSYWSRQATYDRISAMRSNATLGVQNVASSSGEEYKVPNGYDQYWVDGLGNLYGGSWLSQPDLNWQPLTPTGSIYSPPE